MPVQIVGDVPLIKRVTTGLYSFDHAFVNRKGDIGFPVGWGVEIFGATNCGKSTITYGLSGLLARSQQENIALADFEGFDPEFLITVLGNSGFDGKVIVIQKGEDETTLDELIEHIKKDCCIGIVDSIGAISPIAEQSGSLGEANMGRRALIMAQFTRKIIKILRETDNKTVFLINHAYPKIGGRGLDTPGGEVKKYLASIRISVRRRYYKGKYEEFPDGSYIIEGTVMKNRWGYKDRKFHLFVLAGKGIHLGLTAMYDGIQLGLIDRKKTIKIGDQSFGYLKDVVMKAHEGDDEFFSPFMEVLANVESETDNETSEDFDQSDDTEGNFEDTDFED